MTAHRTTGSTLSGPHVGVSAVVVRSGRVLVGRRRGSHGAGAWAFPGGKPDPGEHPADTVRRELFEETGLRAMRVEPLAWTSDVLTDAGLHFITLHHQVTVDDGEPQVREPDKVHSWLWAPWNRLPEPLFEPTASLLATGWQPAEGHFASA
jgi:8-oxo-dGTP diphosphatase